jgi:hypothetical protein
MKPGFIDPILWRDPSGRPWALDTEWALIDDRWECVGVRLRSYTTDAGNDPLAAEVDAKARPVQASDLRALPLRRVLDESRKGWRQAFEHLSQLERESASRRGEEADARLLEAFGKVTASNAAKGGRPPLYDAEHFREVARVYEDELYRGGYPTRAVAERFTVSRSAAAKWVSRCRKLGLLGETEPRKAGGGSPVGEGTP